MKLFLIYFLSALIFLLLPECVKDTGLRHPSELFPYEKIYLEGKNVDLIVSEIQTALKKQPSNPLLHYLYGDIKYLTGDFRGSFSSFLEAIKIATKQIDSESDLIAWLSISSIDAISKYIPQFNTEFSGFLDENMEIIRHKTDASYFALLEQKVEILNKMGKFEEAIKTAEDGGCITKWMKAGPFGSTEVAGFDEIFPPENDVIWRSLYESGEGKKVIAVLPASTERCWVNIGDDSFLRGGTFYAFSQISVSSKTKVAMKLSSTEPTLLLIDGQEILRSDRRNSILPNSIIFILPFEPGIHNITVKISSRDPSPRFSLKYKESAYNSNKELLNDADNIRQLPADLSVVPVALPPDVNKIEYFSPPPADTDIAKLLFIDTHILWGSNALAYPVLFELQKKYPHSMILFSRAFFLIRLDFTVPYNIRMNQAKLECQKAKERYPFLWIPYIYLSFFESQNGRLEKAAEILNEGIENSPLFPDFYSNLAEIYQNLDWKNEAVQALQKASLMLDGTCLKYMAELNIATIYNDTERMEKAASLLFECDKTTRNYIQILRENEKWEEAEKLAVMQLKANPDDIWNMVDAGWSAFKKGEINSYLNLLLEVNSKFPRTFAGTVKLADLLSFMGKRDDAGRSFFKLASIAPEFSIEACRKLSGLLGLEYLFHFRKSFEEVIASFNSSGQVSYQNTSSIEILDHVTHRIFADGSSISRYHSIKKLITKEGVEKNGEFKIPPGAILLKIRTVKPDGTSLEPEKISEKTSLSYPNLEPGDYTETEWVQFNPPSNIFSGGTMLERWYFKVPDLVLHRSELFLIVPSDIKFDINPRGLLPQPEVYKQNGITIYSWVVKESSHIKYEPNSPNLTEFLPSIQISYRTSWDKYTDWLHDQLMDTMIVTPVMKKKLDEILSKVNSQDEEAKSAEIYKWVCEEIEDDSDITKPVSYIFHEKRGNRVKILYALLKSAGVPAEFHIAETIFSDKTKSDTPDFNKFTDFVVFTGKTWVVPAYRKAYYGFLPNYLENQDTLRLFPSAGKGHISSSSIDENETKQELFIEVDEGGLCHCKINILYQGAKAALIRENLINISKIDMKNQIESLFLAPNFPGATIESIDLPDLEESNKKLSISVIFSFPAQHGPFPGSFIISPILKSQIAVKWAQLSARNFPLLIDEILYTSTKVVIDGGKFWKVVPPPRTKFSISGSNGIFFSQEVSLNSDESKLTLNRKIIIPAGRILPSDYKDFLSFANAVDEVEGGVYMLKLKN